MFDVSLFVANVYTIDSLLSHFFTVNLPLKKNNFCFRISSWQQFLSHINFIKLNMHNIYD